MCITQNCHIRPLKPADCKRILDIQTACYPAGLVETAEVLLAKHTLSPQSCWIAESRDQIVGYLFTHPWHDTSPPALNIPLTALPSNASTFFLHDLAIHPAARGQGIAQALLDHALRWAQTQRYRKAMLVAVQGSLPFWEYHGFMTQSDGHVAPEKLKAYGPGASHLVAEIQ